MEPVRDAVDCESLLPVLTEEQFCALMERIERLGYDEETAARFAALIGATPHRDEQGRIVVLDRDGRELARLALTV